MTDKKEQQLTAEQEARAHSIASDEEYRQLAMRIARAHSSTDHDAIKRFKRIPAGDVETVADSCLDDAAIAYALTGLTLPREEEKRYLVKCMHNVISNYLRAERRAHNAGGLHRTITLKEAAHDYCMHDVTEEDGIRLEEALPAFAKALPATERIVLEAVMKIDFTTQQPTHEQFAVDTGIGVRHLRRILRSIMKKMQAWFAEVYGFYGDAEPHDPIKREPVAHTYAPMCAVCLVRIEHGVPVAWNAAYREYVHYGCRNAKPDMSPPRLSQKGDIAQVMGKPKEPDQGSEPSKDFCRLSFRLVA